MANRWGNSGNSGWLYFGGAPKSLQMAIAAMKLKDAYSLKGKLTSCPFLDSILKSTDITFSTKVCLVKAMVFAVVMYRCELDYKESWSLKNLCFWTVVLENSWESLGLQGDPISPEYSLEGLMLKLKLQYFGHLMRRTDSFEKTLMLRNIEGERRRGQ